jgi:drug/metabolite transporter (DMT)-like permease
MSAQVPAGASARHPGLSDYALLVGLSLLWGSSFLAIKVAVDHGMPPLTLAALRVGIGAALLLLVARSRGQTVPPIAGAAGRRLWLRILLLGIVGNSLPFFLIGWGEQTTTSQLAGILMATIPLMVVILAHFLTHDEPLTVPRLAGVGLGFTGMLVLIGADALRGLGAQVAGQALIICGCISYALYGVNAKRLPKLPPQMLVGVILAAGFAAMLPFWLALDRPWSLTWDWRALAAALWLGIVSTGAGNLLYYVIMRRVAVGFASFNNYLVPPISLIYGYFLYGERPRINALVALGLILLGLILPRLADARLRRTPPLTSRD